ncbi:MAG: TetR/AcrR family transcriptional regulator [Actinomycetota bacterium]
MSTKTADETTERIRSAALALFASRGYGNTTIEHISTAAGVGVATIYRRWDDKAAIANDLYALGLDSMATILAEPEAAEPEAQFVEVWNRAWAWATSNPEMFHFLNASLGGPWLSRQNAERKVAMSETEVAMYARLRFDAPADFAAALIGGSLASVMELGPDIAPDEVAARLWRALNLGD